MRRFAAVSCLELLLEQGAEVDARNKAARVPLHLVAETSRAAAIGEGEMQQAETIRLLARYGADLDA